MTADTHLTELELEALAHRRLDLVDGQQRDHAKRCETCQAEILHLREESAELGAMLRSFEPPQADLSSMIAGALAKERIAVSRRSALWSGLVASLLALSFGGIAVAQTLSGGSSLWGSYQSGVSLASGVDRVVTVLLPGGWLTVSMVALLGLVPMALMLVTGKKAIRVLAAALHLGLLLLALVVPSFYSAAASALDFEGAWPEEESEIDLDAENLTVHEVLRQASEQVDLGYVGRLPESVATRPMNLRIEDASLRDVVDALLGSEELVARRTERMLIIEPRSDEVAAVPSPPETPTPAAISQPPAPPSVPVVPAPTGHVLGERVSFGNDIFVGPGERVKEVVSMGGDIVVEGEVMGDAVTMGGDLTIREGGKVHGEIVTMGGNLTVEGDGGAQVQMQNFQEHEDEDHSEALASAWDDFASNLASHAVIFLVGLFLMSFSPNRLLQMKDAIQKRPIKTTFAGLASVIVVPVLMLVMVITVIGIPPALALGVLSAVIFYTAFAMSSWLLGRTVKVKALRERPILQLGLGVVVLLVFSSIPVIGFFVDALALSIGTGAVLLTGFGTHEIA